jgi:hypothetical protein
VCCPGASAFRFDLRDFAERLCGGRWFGRSCIYYVAGDFG